MNRRPEVTYGLPRRGGRTVPALGLPAMIGIGVLAMIAVFVLLALVLRPSHPATGNPSSSPTATTSTSASTPSGPDPTMTAVANSLWHAWSQTDAAERSKELGAVCVPNEASLIQSQQVTVEPDGDPSITTGSFGATYVQKAKDHHTYTLTLTPTTTPAHWVVESVQVS